MFGFEEMSTGRMIDAEVFTVLSALCGGKRIRPYWNPAIPMPNFFTYVSFFCCNKVFSVLKGVVLSLRLYCV